LRGSLALTLILAVAVAPASAQDFEARVGADISHIELDNFYTPQVGTISLANLDSLSLDLIWTPPDNQILFWLGSPRLELGGLISLSGHESQVHIGPNWHVPVFETPLFLEFGLGVAAHNGYASDPPPGFRALGCNVAFHYSYGVGAELNDDWTVIAKFQHISHGGLCGPVANQGINNIGIELGYRF
jgi:hypothetical protein